MGQPWAAKKLYLALKKAGMCVRCGVEYTHDGKAHCGKCIERIKDRDRKRKIQAIADGLCPACRRNKPTPGLQQCASCRILNAADKRKAYAAAKKERTSDAL